MSGHQSGNKRETKVETAASGHTARQNEITWQLSFLLDAVAVVCLFRLIVFQLILVTCIKSFACRICLCLHSASNCFASKIRAMH